MLDRAGMRLSCGHVALAAYGSRYEAWRDLLEDHGSRTWVNPFAKADIAVGRSRQLER